jgi:hypothetical protein
MPSPRPPSEVPSLFCTARQESGVNMKTTPLLHSASQTENIFSPPYDFTITGERDSQSLDPD